MDAHLSKQTYTSQTGRTHIKCTRGGAGERKEVEIEKESEREKIKQRQTMKDILWTEENEEFCSA